MTALEESVAREGGAALARPEIELPAGSLLIGDLHLDLERSGDVESFVRWLEGLPRFPALVVLGDFFEYWIGQAQASSAGGRAVIGALSRLTAAGTAVEVVHGNRDFLLDAGFERATGARVHPDGFVGRTDGGGRVLVVHGDELCTLDRGYLRLRRVLRSGPVRWLARSLPRAVAAAVARRLRRASTAALESKPAAEAEQQPDAARQLVRASGATALVCGHAHRFRDESLAGGVPGGGARWLVLDAFGGELDLLRVGPGGALTPSGSGYAPGHA